jgi:hypothetical protein
VQGSDKYAYVGNNSINRTDPTGHKCKSDDGCDTPHGDKIEPKNILGRHLSNKEKRMLAAIIMGESSTWNDSGYYEWIIWGLLNKVSFDQSMGRDWSVYRSWQMEESTLLSVDFSNTTGQYGTSEAERTEMLLSMANLYNDGKISDKKGGDLSDEYKMVLGKIDEIDKMWYENGPNSPEDPTHGGVGHVKHSYGTVNEAEAARKDKGPYGPYPQLYSAASPIYKNLFGQWAFITMNTPYEGWP